MDEPRATTKAAPLLLPMCLLGAGVLLGVGGPICGAMYLASSLRSEPGAWVRDLPQLFMLIVGSPAAACALWAMANIAGRKKSPAVEPHVEPTAPAFSSPAAVQTAAPQPAAAQPAQATTQSDPALSKLLAEIAELNANLLLTDTQKQDKLRYRRQTLTEQTVKDVEIAMSKEDFQQADQLIDALDREGGDPTTVATLRSRLAHTRAGAQSRQVSAAKKRVAEFMAAGDFAQAQQVAGDLATRYSRLGEVHVLLEHVQREANAFSQEQRKRLLADVERLAAARQWRQALAAGMKLLREYPNSKEADNVALQMPTIQENARIEEVREMRDTLRDMLQRHRYADAITIARDVIARFPETQAAAELRPQLPRLEELAREGAEKK